VVDERCRDELDLGHEHGVSARCRRRGSAHQGVCTCACVGCDADIATLTG
jgi:hypothetical protein